MMASYTAAAKQQQQQQQDTGTLQLESYAVVVRINKHAQLAVLSLARYCCSRKGWRSLAQI
jgi:hypothetical protein